MLLVSSSDSMLANGKHRSTFLVVAKINSVSKVIVAFMRDCAVDIDSI